MMAQNNTSSQQNLQALIDKEKQIDGLLDRARQEADQQIASAQKQAEGIQKSAQQEAQSQAQKLLQEASSLQTNGGKDSGSSPTSDSPSQEALEQAARQLVELVTGKEEG